MKKRAVPEEIQDLLKTVYDCCQQEDVAVRERQIRNWRRLKLLWEGFQRVWYSEVAHDWRILDETQSENSDQAAYDKPINVFKAYLETIIAALSVTIPPIKCYPDDADNMLDLATAKAGDKIAQLVYRHNNAPLLWLHSLFISVTEGMVACYTYPKADKSYGTYTNNEYDEVPEDREIKTCPICGTTVDERVLSPEESMAPPIQGLPQDPSQQLDQAGMQPQMQQPDMQPQQGMQQQPELDRTDEFMPEPQDMCPACSELMNPQVKRETFVVTRLVGSTEEPKSRVCQEFYGGLNIKIANYARNQAGTPYLIYSCENDYALTVEEFIHLHGNKKLLESMKDQGNPGGYTEYEQWGRLPPQYQGEYPTNVVTTHRAWIRPGKFNVLNDKDDIRKLKKLYPDGVKVTFVNDQFADAENESLDDCWTISENPMSDFVHFEPLGQGLVSVQDITNDLISLVLQTIEHGISQAFADPAVLNFKGYAQTETTPGGIFPATPKSGKSIGDGFYEMRTATLSAEVLPFSTQIQSLGQFTSGALPSLFGGNLEGGGDTASEYGMSQASAKQRLQSSWKMFTIFWKTIYSKVIPMYIKEMKDDERDVQKNVDGSFVNVLIRKADVEGKLGKIELESNENLPLTWQQRNQIVEKLMLNGNPEITKIFAAPENIPIIHEALGLTDFYVPGEDDVIKQYDEIKVLLNSEPIPNPQDPMNPELPSVEIDPLLDNHAIEFEICRKWAISELGRQTKILNEIGYKNVLLHAKMHYTIIQQQQMQQQQAQMQQQESQGPQSGKGSAPHEKPNKLENKQNPIQGDADVQTIM